MQDNNHDNHHDETENCHWNENHEFIPCKKMKRILPKFVGKYPPGIAQIERQIGLKVYTVGVGYTKKGDKWQDPFNFCPWCGADISLKKS